MDLTPTNKAEIDRLNYEELLFSSRFAPSGDPWMQGETCKYWYERMAAMRTASPTLHEWASARVGEWPR